MEAWIIDTQNGHYLMPGHASWNKKITNAAVKSLPSEKGLNVY